MITKTLQPTLGRTKEVILVEAILQREKHLHNQDGRRILVKSYVLSVMTMVTMLHNVHTGREGEEGSMHQHQRLMRLQIGLRGRSCCFSPFQVQFPVGQLGWWIVKHLSI
jgi:hypothetical protein